MRVSMGSIHRGMGQETLISEGQSCPADSYQTQIPSGNQPGICMQSFCYPLPGGPACPANSVPPPASGPDSDDLSTWDLSGPITVTSEPAPIVAPIATAPIPAPTPVPAAPAPAAPITQATITQATTTPPVNLTTVPVAAPASTAASSITSDFGWLTETSIDSIPNWALLAGGAVFLFLLLGHKR
jgi:hypothetical protein